jgi:guanylate kinase
MEKNRLVVLVGISASGKDALIREAGQLRPLHKLVSATTRAPREGERNGVDYHFLSRTAFDAAVAAGEMFEWTEFSGDCYGTLLSELQGSGLRVCIRENQGAKDMQARLGATVIAVWPPRWEDAEQRMRDRGDSEEQIAGRLVADHARAAEIVEIAQASLVNDDLSRAAAELVSIMDTLA